MRKVTKFKPQSVLQVIRWPGSTLQVVDGAANPAVPLPVHIGNDDVQGGLEPFKNAWFGYEAKSAEIPGDVLVPLIVGSGIHDDGDILIRLCIF